MYDKLSVRLYNVAHIIMHVWTEWKKIDFKKVSSYCNDVCKVYSGKTILAAFISAANENKNNNTMCTYTIQIYFKKNNLQNIISCCPD